MSTILVKCQDQVLAFENTPLIASGDVGVDFVQFDFCSLWDGYKRTAVFWRNEKDVYHVNLDDEDRCEIPPEVLQDGGLIYFGAFGVNAAGQQRTSKVLTYRIEQGAITTDTKPSDPTPDIYTQIMQEFLNFEAEITQRVEQFEQTMGTSWAEYQTNMGQAWTTYKQAMSQQQSTFEQAMTQAWEQFKTGGDFVLKTDYEAYKQEAQAAIEGKAAGDHKHAAGDITSGTMPVSRGGTGVASQAALDELVGVSIGPYLSFAANANEDAVSAAFGKNNESRVKGIGRAIAMYAWYKGSTSTFTNLLKLSTLTDIYNTVNAKKELWADQFASLLINSNKYAREKIANVITHNSTSNNTKNYTISVTSAMLSGGVALDIYAKNGTGGNCAVKVTLNGKEVAKTNTGGGFVFDGEVYAKFSSFGITAAGSYTLSVISEGVVANTVNIVASYYK